MPRSFYIGKLKEESAIVPCFNTFYEFVGTEYRKVGVKDINFKASPEFIKDVKRETDRDLERDMGGVKVIRKQLYSREERIARALEVIEKNGVLTLSD